MPTSRPTLSRRSLVASAAALVPAIAAAPALADAKRQALVNDALASVQRVIDSKEFPEAINQLKRARGVLILPSFTQAAFLIGGAGGRGVLLARNGANDWSYPAFMTMGSGSLGLQVGGRVQEILLIVLTDKGLNALLESKFKFGAEGGVTVINAGVGIAGATTGAVGADIVAYSKASGLYVGAALDGSYLEPDNDWNALYYGQGARGRDVITERRYTNPGANGLRQYLARF
ncbi:lipid-binding SYLF domain-containing protein [Reyranella sp. CPCC 100927]|uniref:lipid-binding SYLF domain-containing protein n=1 Tax=Reyranella sp. CPCC 100927 TaxID=2599616 RepID=UPI0011B62808|nr:lipid-binding SYLF domain-containing protein [Reyranella sp. CPCC 100927]TWT14877.1 lipid-binding SYLF domain-containing protein [Reyranella sp. CPCC 100927]